MQAPVELQDRQTRDAGVGSETAGEERGGPRPWRPEADTEEGEEIRLPVFVASSLGLGRRHRYGKRQKAGKRTGLFKSCHAKDLVRKKMSKRSKVFAIDLVF